MPANIAAVKSSTGTIPVTVEVSAGPGQNPASPQPAPKSAAPRTSGLSMSRRLGIPKRSPTTGPR